MAEKRMFAKIIIDSDLFLDMPLSTQALYFHLSMRADDEGFMNNPKKIQRAIGCTDDDMKLLIAKSYIIPFKSGVIVIKHWLIHNTLRKDRMTLTTYTNEKSMLRVEDNGAYSMIDNQLSTNCQPLDNQASTNCPHRLDKISIDKNRLYENIEEKERTTPKNKKNVKDNKNNNAEAVTLTEKEYDKLMSEHSKPFVDKCIEILNNYKLSKGVKYKSDYHAIRSWVIGEVQKRYPQLASQPSEQQDPEDLFKNPWTDI